MSQRNARAARAAMRRSLAEFEANDEKAKEIEDEAAAKGLTNYARDKALDMYWYKQATRRREAHQKAVTMWALVAVAEELEHEDGQGVSGPSR